MGHIGLIQLTWLKVNSYRLTEKNVKRLIKVSERLSWDIMEKISIWSLLVDGICLAVVGIPILVIKYSVNPTQRGFFCSDSSLYYPYYSSTIPTSLNVTLRNRSTKHTELPSQPNSDQFNVWVKFLSCPPSICDVVVDCLIVTECR